MPVTDERLLSVSKAASELREVGLRCSENTLRRWIKAGDIRTRRIGGSLMISERELASFVEEGKRGQ